MNVLQIYLTIRVQTEHLPHVRTRAMTRSRTSKGLLSVASPRQMFAAFKTAARATMLALLRLLQRKLLLLLLLPMTGLWRQR